MVNQSALPLYSDGEALFAHGHRRKSSVTLKIAAPGLVSLQHQCASTGATITANGLSVTAADQAIALVASVPLTKEPWQAMTEGELNIFRASRIVAKRNAANI